MTMDIDFGKLIFKLSEYANKQTNKDINAQKGWQREPFVVRKTFKRLYIVSVLSWEKTTANM